MTKKEMLRIVNENISRLKDKTFNIYFFVLDTKGNPSSALEYIYQTALVLSKKGYNVTMLHQEKDFVGVKDWLGEEYANLKHANIEKDNVAITPSDFLFIPEIFANIMIQTKKLPCKRVIIVQTASHITEFMPVSHTLDTLNIVDAIVTTEEQEKRLKDYFPDVRTHIVSPSIKKIFRRGNDVPKKLIVNVVAKDQSVINRMVKPFYWKNPLYKWVSFRDLRGLPQETFAEALREAAITIWEDDSTSFGYTLLEALRSGGLVIAKMPDEFSDWMIPDGNLTENILWFNSTEDIAVLLPKVIQNWITDNLSADLYEKEKAFDDFYSEEDQEKEIEQAYINELFDKRLKEFEEAKIDVENNVIKTKEDEQ